MWDLMNTDGECLAGKDLQVVLCTQSESKIQVHNFIGRPVGSDPEWIRREEYL